jgi:GT2 family glycosyltransferase
MLYVIVPVHNRAAVTARLLDALALQTVADFTLVLVDDGCTDDTVAVTRAKIPADRLIVLSGDGQLWWAGALQLAYEHLRAIPVSPHDAVLVVNDDVTFAPDFLEKGLQVLRERPDSCIQAIGIDEVSGEIDRGAIADMLRLRFRPAQAGEATNCLSTRGLLMSGRTFAASGGFRPRLLPHYLSDYEFTLRLRRQHVALVVDDRFVARTQLHLTGMDTAGAGGAKVVWRDSFSNRAKFNPKHWTAFVVLACPAWTVPLHLARIWLRFGLKLMSAGRSPGRPA